MARLARHLRLALSVGLVGGFLLGCREALLSLEANAVVQPGDYLFVYAAVPILIWVGLGVLLVLPLGLAVGALYRAAEPRETLWLYASGLAFAGALSITVPLVASVSSLLQEVGMPIAGSVRVVLWFPAIVLAAAAAALVGCAAAWYATWTPRPLRYATWATVAAVVPLLWPPLSFLATDWKWDRAAGQIAAAQSVQPHVLLISIDTLRADQLASYGDQHGLTGQLDRLAGEGVLFERAITSSPWTLPAVASLLTAQYPHHHGAGYITNGRTPLGRSALPAQTWTLATALHERGYQTHAIVTNPYLALRYGFGQGFDSYENVTIESEAFLSFANTTALRMLQWLRPDFTVGDRGATVSARAQRWLAGTDTARPFFLWLHYIDPHPPYSREGVAAHKSMRGDISFRRADTDVEPIALTSPDVARLRSGEIRLNAEQKEAVRGLYRGEVANLDRAVGTVLEELDRRGLRERTLVICVADHGEEFWEHGGVEHGHTVYDELVRVPLLMRWPGQLPARTRVDAVVRTVDVAPTILDLLGIPTPAGLDGATLLPLIHGEAAAPRVALSENLLFAEERFGLRTLDRKYVRWENGKEEVYDLDADPQERRDLVALEDALGPLRQLSASLDLRVAAASRARSQAPLDDGTTHALRALGYVH